MISRVLTTIILLLQLLYVGVAAEVFAQVDPAKLLIGRWDGHIDAANNQDRTLIINSVQANGEGEWIGRGRFGRTSQVKMSAEAVAPK